MAVAAPPLLDVEFFRVAHAAVGRWTLPNWKGDGGGGIQDDLRENAGMRALRSTVATMFPRINTQQATRDEDIIRLVRKLGPLDNAKGLVRFGPAGDGGYLMPDDLDGVGALISPGVSQQCGFDLEIANRGIQVYMADFSVDTPPVKHPNFNFVKKYLDTYSSDESITLDAMLQPTPLYSSGTDLIMQMDIEGAEYRLLHSIKECLLKRFRIIIIEFHNLHQLYWRFQFDFIRSAFEKILQGHNVVHIHPNNCHQPVRRGKFYIPPVMEFTFYRRDRDTFRPGSSLRFPHRLDADNVPGRPSVVLPECWR